jgi:hypothetical protein
LEELAQLEEPAQPEEPVRIGEMAIIGNRVVAVCVDTSARMRMHFVALTAGVSSVRGAASPIGRGEALRGGVAETE